MLRAITGLLLLFTLAVPAAAQNPQGELCVVSTSGEVVALLDFGPLDPTTHVGRLDYYSPGGSGSGAWAPNPSGGFYLFIGGVVITVYDVNGDWILFWNNGRNYILPCP